MKIKPSDITCVKEDFIKAKDILLQSQDTDERSLRNIILAIKYFSKKFSISLDKFDEKVLLEKMKHSDDFSHVGLANRIEEILGYNNSLDSHYLDALNASSMVLRVSLEGKILWANKAFTDVTGYDLDEIIGLETRQLSGGFSKEKPEDFWKNMRQTILSGNIWKGKIKNQTKDGVSYWTDTTIIPRMVDGKLEDFTVVRTDITENENLKNDLDKVDDLRKLHKKLIEENARLGILSMTDSLTGLHNRRAFDEKLDEEISRAKRSNTNLSLILFDVDHFKKINDTYGHDIGDIVLKLIAEELNAITRDIDFKFRVGGEEFAIILAGESLESTLRFTEKIRYFFENLNMEGLPKFTMSFGISFFKNIKDQEISKEMIFKKADEALYKAKYSGRNCVKI